MTHDQVEALTFAEKVMVMYAGEMVQVGTPQELFETPNHKFVGYFIGSPGMNFIPCTVDGNVARFNGAAINLDDRTAALASKAQGYLELGIRPIHLKVHGQSVEGGVAALVRSVEDQGSHKIVCLAVDEHLLYARLAEEDPVPEDRAWVAFPPQWTRLYADERLLR